MEVINAVGRRKSAIARVYLSQGTGNVTVNGKDFKEYFPIETLQYIVMQPFGVLSLNGKFDVKATIDGGGVKGQAEAVRRLRRQHRFRLCPGRRLRRMLL